MRLILILTKLWITILITMRLPFIIWLIRNIQHCQAPWWYEDIGYPARKNFTYDDDTSFYLPHSEYDT